MVSVRGACRCTIALLVAAWLLARAEAAHARRYKVEIDSRPSGAEIFLNDAESTPIGVTPLKNKKLEPGTYTVIIKKDGFETEYEQIRVKRGRSNRFVIQLERVELAALEVVPTDALAKRLTGARVLIDGEDRGALPLEIDVAAGSHVIEVTKKGFESFELWVELDRGAREKVVARLTPSEGGGGADNIDPFVAPGRSASVTKKARPTKQAPPSLGAVDDPPMVVIGGGFGMGGRYFRYDNPTTANLRSYDSFGVPRFRLMAELYPLVLLDTPAIAGLGFTGSFGRAFPLTSFTNDGEGLETTWTDFDAGLRYQYRFESVTVGAAIAYGQHAYTFDEASPLFTEVPVVDYRFVRFGADVAARLHKYLSVFGGGSFLMVSSLGELGDRFGDSSAFGVGTRVGGIFHLGSGVDLRLEASGSRFGHSYTPSADMTFVADGGTDLLGNVFIGGAYTY